MTMNCNVAVFGFCPPALYLSGKMYSLDHKATGVQFLSEPKFVSCCVFVLCDPSEYVHCIVLVCVIINHKFIF